MKLFLDKYLLILLLLLVGMVLGFTHLSRYQLNNDEMLTLNTATGLGHSSLIDNTWGIRLVPPDKKVFSQNDYWNRNSISNVLHNTASYNGNMVAYNILLYYFINATYVDDGLLRGLSAIFYIISILLVFFIARGLFTDVKAALICAALFAINPFVINIAHDLRGYSFTIMTTLLATIIVLKLEKKEPANFKSTIGWALLLGILYGVSLLSHYFALYVIAGHIIYALYSYFISRKNIFAPLCIALFICSLFFTAWWINGGKEGYQSMKIQDNYILKITSLQTHSSFTGLTMASVCFLNSVMGYYFQFMGYRNSSFFYVLALPLIALGLSFFLIPIDKRYKNSLVFIAIMAVSCIVFLQISSILAGHTTSLLMTRFGSFGCPYLMMLFGYALYRLIHSNRIVLKVFAVLLLSVHVILNIMCYPIPFNGYHYTYSDMADNGEIVRIAGTLPNPYSKAAKDIIQHYAPGDTVVYNDFNMSQDVNLYLRDVKYPITQKVDPSQKEDYMLKTPQLK